MRAANVLSTLAAVAFLASPALAQQTNSSPAVPSAESSAEPSSTSSSSNEASTSSSDSSSSPTQTTTSSSASSESKTVTPTSTPSSTSTSSSSRSRASTTTTSSSSSSASVPSGLPTLTQGVIPTYPAPSVPPTKDAPFMQQSSAPDGTVFIAVGAILGAFGLAILLWRSIVSLLLHRSVRRAALAQHEANNKAGFPAPPAPFYKYIDQASPGGTPAGRGVRRSNRNTVVTSSTPTQSTLFFSPTAATATTPGNRGSTFLPSGFYAAGSSSIGPHGHSISMTNLRPDAINHPNGSRNSLMNLSPPDSPHFTPLRDLSMSSVNMNARLPGQRAPSAYLEDLLADDPGSLPPPQVPTPDRRGAGSPHGRR